MLVSLITLRKYRTLLLPEWKEGFFCIGEDEQDGPYFEVVGNGDGWRIDEVGGSRFLDEKPKVLESGSLLRVRIGHDLDLALLFVEDSDVHYARYATCKVADGTSFVVGSHEACDLVLRSGRVSERHCRLSYAGKTWTVEDLGSATGTFVDGQRVERAQLKPGSVVNVLNQKFIVLPGVLAFNAQYIDYHRLEGVLEVLRHVDVADKELLKAGDPVNYFHREPRFTNGVFEEDIVVNAPSARQVEQGREDALLTYGPAVTSSMAMLLGGLANPVMGAGMLAGSLLWPSLRSRKERKLAAADEAERQAQYEEYLQQVDRRLDELNRQQTEQLRRQNISPRSEVTALLQDSHALWNRRPEHDDFLDVRLGLGNMPVKADISFPEVSYDIEDPLVAKLRALQDKPRLLRDVPIVLSLSNFYSVGVTGERRLVMQYAASMICQLAMHVGYDDLKLCLLGELPGGLEMLRWLPHTWDDQQTVHLVAKDKDELSKLTPALDALLADHRTTQFKSEINASSQTVVFLITDTQLAQSGMVMRLLYDQQLDNVHVIALARRPRELPRRTNLVVGLRARGGRVLWQDEYGRQRMDFSLDEGLGRELGPLVRMMANTQLDIKLETARMPETVPFLDMFGMQDVSHLGIVNRWHHSNPMRSLAAPIGVSEDGNLCMLDLHERADGPHGLVAGTTGSGKSEMLMTYVLSMAVTYSPAEVAFVFIDYKGGDMAQAFETLPHTAGIITNLDGNEIHRSLLSIEAELTRRQRVFRDCQKKLGMRNLDIYAYQRLWREGKVGVPMQHLIIISDEFAELKTQEPEFLEQLIRAARIGRSLGVHLILATQKPGGVVDDQIWSNSNFHICLRVQNESDSRDVLKCEDAAHLSRPGSLYKQVGYGEVLVKVQSAWTGADYVPDGLSLPNCRVEVLDHMGSVLRREEYEQASAGARMPQLQAVVDHLGMLATKSGMHARRLWTQPLPAKISLAALREQYGGPGDPHVLNPLLGEMDDPARQRRLPVRVPLSSGRNAVIIGSTGSGKLMAIRTLMEDLLTTHTADDLRVYLLDCADDGLRAYLPAPQVADVITSEEVEKRQRLFMLLETEVRLRRRLLGAGDTDMPLGERLQQLGLPHIVVVLHHLVTLQGLVEDTEEQFRKLLADGPRCGVSFVATQERTSGLHFQLSQSFPSRYVLKLDLDDDYPMILGRTNGMKPGKPVGRGLLSDGELYEFQVATADQDPGELCASLAAAWTGISAEPIRVLPDRVTVDALLPECDKQDPLRIPVGYETETMRTSYLDLRSRFVHVVTGIEREASHTLCGIAELAHAAGIAVTALDPTGDLERVQGIEHVGRSELAAHVAAMFGHCAEVRALIDAGGAPTAEVRLVVIPDLSAVKLELDGERWEELTAILEKTRPEWGWRFVLGGAPDSIASQQYEEWFRQSVSRSDGIYLGRGMADQMLLQADRYLNAPIEYPDGYVIQAKRAVRVRFVQTD